MDPVRAAALGISPDEIQVTCEGGRYNNEWIVWVPLGDGSKYIITQCKRITQAVQWRVLHRVAKNGA